jgi:hypothetical protein
VSFLVGFFYLGYKLLHWQNFEVGMAPLLIGLFFFGSVQLLFLGVVGEYVGAIHTQVLKRPLVVEAERINFDVDRSAGDHPPLLASDRPPACIAALTAIGDAPRRMSSGTRTVKQSPGES